MNETEKSRRGAGSIRWWPVGIILALVVIAFVALRCSTQPSQQDFNIRVALIVAGAAVLLFVWAMFFSRLRSRTRWTFFGLSVGGVVLFFALFRIHGVNGNLVPIVELRWAHRELQAPALVAPVVVVNNPTGAADFPQFLGPTRDGHLPGPKLATNWTATPPKEVWRQAVGAGWSGFAVAGAVAITQEQRGDDECVVAYNLETGKALWLHTDRKHYANPLAGEGPRATPTIAGQRVLTHGSTGFLICLSLVDGHLLWSKKDDGAVPVWGEATSPLVENDLVMVNAGGPEKTALVAYHLADGSLAWSMATKSGGYSSPILATLAGTKQVLIFAQSLFAADPATGKELWQFPWPGGSPHIASPVIINDSDVMISSGYGAGSARLKIEHRAGGEWSATQVWRSNRMKAKFADLILRQGYIYGLDDGIMACIDAGTGALAWKDGRYGHGQTLLVGDELLVMAENGDVILIDPQPDRLRELTRFTVFTEKTWNPPALAGDYLLVRTDKEAACFRMPLRD